MSLEEVYQASDRAASAEEAANIFFSEEEQANPRPTAPGMVKEVSATLVATMI